MIRLIIITLLKIDAAYKRATNFNDPSIIWQPNLYEKIEIPILKKLAYDD